MSSKGATTMGKRLQAESYYDQFDIDSDGIVTDDEISRAEQMMIVENEDKKQDAQRNMAWFALGGMLLYPFSVVLAVWLNLDKAGDILGDMAATYFVSVAAIVAAFYGKEAFAARNNPPAAPAPRTFSAPTRPAPKGPAPQQDEEL
jgi:hypothetical protein